MRYRVNFREMAGLQPGLGQNLERTGDGQFHQILALHRRDGYRAAVPKVT